MIVDTSALLAVLFQEPDAAWFAGELAGAERLFISPVNALEADIVIFARKGEAGRREWELLRLQAGIESIPFTEAMEETAAALWRKFGKGRPARLNMGDCCAAALAQTAGLPLLTKDSGLAAAAAHGGEFSVRMPPAEASTYIEAWENASQKGNLPADGEPIAKENR